MSWSFQAIGSPENVVKALEANSEQISKNPNDYSRVEFDESKPHLIALVKANFVEDGFGYSKPAIKLTASGSASSQTKPGEPSRRVQSQVSVTLENVYGWVG